MLHKKQNTIFGTDEKKGEYIEIELPIYTHYDLLKKVLQFGKNTEIIEPEDIRKIWIDSIKEMYEMYIK